MKHNVVHAVLVFSTIACMSLPTITAFAANDVTQRDVDVNSDAAFSVTVNGQGSFYLVTIPKTIIGLGVFDVLDYIVTVSGDFASNQQVVVTPAETIVLESDKHSDFIADITQDKMTWLCDELDTVGNGVIACDNIKADNYQGIFNFDIELNVINNKEKG